MKLNAKNTIKWWTMKQKKLILKRINKKKAKVNPD